MAMCALCVKHKGLYLPTENMSKAKCVSYKNWGYPALTYYGTMWDLREIILMQIDVGKGQVGEGSEICS